MKTSIFLDLFKDMFFLLFPSILSKSKFFWMSQPLALEDHCRTCKSLMVPWLVVLPQGSGFSLYL